MDTEDTFILTRCYRARMANEFIITESDCMDEGPEEESTLGTSWRKNCQQGLAMSSLDGEGNRVR